MFAHAPWFYQKVDAINFWKLELCIMDLLLVLVGLWMYALTLITVPPTNYFPREFSRIFANFRKYSRMKKKKKKKKKNIFLK